MRTPQTRAGAVGIASGMVLMAATLPAGPAPEPRPLTSQQIGALRRGILPDVHARHQRIETELSFLSVVDDVPWWAEEFAGTYYCGATSDVCRIAIAPDSGVSYIWSGSFGITDCNHGEIIETFDDGVRVRLALDPARVRNRFMDRRLYFIAWGDARFLVPESRMIDVVNQYNHDESSRALMCLVPYKCKRQGDYMFPKPVKGSLVLPDPWADLLVEHRHEIRVVEVFDEQETAWPRGMHWLKFRVRLDGGRNKEMYVGQELWGDDDSGFSPIRIEQVEEDWSVGRYSTTTKQLPHGPRPGVGTVYIVPGMGEGDEPAIAPADG